MSLMSIAIYVDINRFINLKLALFKEQNFISLFTSLYHLNAFI